MIARIEGTLQSIEEDAALVRLPNGLTYEVLLPAHTATRLAASEGKSVTLETRDFIEGGGGGSTMIPRIAGFATPEDRRFFDLFITCRGIGQRKALRAMAIATGQIAGAICDRDAATLKTLPEVGKRTAETIIATLHGKVDDLVTSAAFGAGEGADDDGRGGVAREALEALLQLGEQRTEATAWIDQAMREEDEAPGTADELLERVYRIKAGG